MLQVDEYAPVYVILYQTFHARELTFSWLHRWSNDFSVILWIFLLHAVLSVSGSKIRAAGCVRSFTSLFWAGIDSWLQVSGGGGKDRGSWDSGKIENNSIEKLLCYDIVARI